MLPKPRVPSCTEWLRRILITASILAQLTCASSSSKSSPTPFQNSSTTFITSTTASGQTSTSIPASITSCPLPNIIDYINPNFILELVTLPLTSAEAVLEAEIFKLEGWMQTLARIDAQSSYKNPSLISSYSTSLNSAIYSEIDVLFAPQVTAQAVPFLLYFGMTDGCLFSTCVTQYTNLYSSYLTASPITDFTFIASPPCCGACQLTGNAVQLEYWPTPAPTPAITLLTDAFNHTYVSPSVYATFTNLYATDYCGRVGSTSYNYLTVALNPSDISTSTFFTDVAGLLAHITAPSQWTTINFGDFADSKCKCTTSCLYDPILEMNLTNICTPQMSMPAKVSTLDPAWMQCSPDYGGVFDPPIALPSAPGLSVPKTTFPPPPPPPHTTLTTPPSPIGVVVPPTATQTTTTTSVPPPPPPPPPASTSSPHNTVPAPSISISSPQNTIEAPPPATVLASIPPNSNTASNPTSSAAAPLSNPAPIPASSPPITINGIGLTPVAGSSSVFIVGSQTIAPGGPPALISGTAVSLAQSGAIVIGGSTITTIGPPTRPPITINGIVLAPVAGSSSAFVVGSQTISPGGPGALVSGTAVSLAQSGAVVIGGTTVATIGPGPLPAAVTTQAAAGASILTVAGQTVTENSQSDFVISGQTLAPGGAPITIGGTVISLGPGGTQIVVGGTTRTRLGSIIMSVFSGSTASETGSPSAATQFTGGSSRVSQGSLLGVLCTALVVLFILL